MNKILDIARDFLIEQLDPVFIIAFGSIVKETNHPESDLDIAFYSKKTINNYDKFILSQKLTDLIKMEVDLVDINYASTVFKAQIFSTGKILYSTDETLRRNIEMTSLSMYAKLNEYRKHILDKAEERGSIYEK
ncbi:type VII toxin-antitoxin system MntA family adenylyltransferase antitoxin [Bacillus sp. SCS-151]|uniref:type VII toxin-antitoxin system MntA family adenylyltransferase antitoxin n=1 Tax=Nanhaiella sioensis TaxID=3115293 RepID=UPI00397AD08D